MDIAARFERSFTLNRERPAVCIGAVQHSYGELRNRVLTIQAMLEAASSASERLVGVVGNVSLDAYAAVLAILRSGRGFVPLNPEHPAQRNASILQQADLRTLIVPDESLAADGGFARGVRLVRTGDGPPAASAAAALAHAGPEDLAYLLFTSGSTGEPKGVPITRGNLSAFLDSLAASGHGLLPTDRVLQMFDMTFDFSIAAYVAPLSSGACVYPVPTGNAKFAEVYRLLSEARITVAPLVPSVLAYLRPYFSDIQLPDLRLTVLCGEALHADIATQWHRCAPDSRIANFYGPTEATVFAMVYEWIPERGCDKSHNGVVSIGKPMPLNAAVVVDGAAQPVATGEQGELCLAGPQLTPGYWRDPQRNATEFFESTLSGAIRRYYRTGDVVTRDADGDHYFCGRIGTQVKLQGYRVELGEIEFHARELVPGHNCVVISCSNDAGSPDLSLVVENYQGDLQAVVAALRQRVPSYMVPQRALSVVHLPMNANGKIDRAALQRALSEQGAADGKRPEQQAARRGRRA